MRHGLGLWILLVLVVSCSNKGENVTREQCTQVADHMADLMIDDSVAHPDAWWDGMAESAIDTGMPKTVTRASFASFLTTPEGKTWLMKRQGAVRAEMEQGIDVSCMKKATPKTIDCLLAAKTQADAKACK
jgi:hypothetical protein